MRKLFDILFLLVLVQVVHAQEIIDLQVSGDSVKVVYELPLYEPKSDKVLIISPRLKGETDTLLMPNVYVRGARNAKSAHRDYVLSGKKKQGAEEQPYLKGDKVEQKLVDSMLLSLSAYPWLIDEKLTLCIERAEEGCCKTEWLGSHCSADKQLPEEQKAIARVSRKAAVSASDSAAVVMPADNMADQQLADNTIVSPADSLKGESQQQVAKVQPKEQEQIASAEEQARRQAPMVAIIAPPTVKRLNTKVVVPITEYKAYTPDMVLSKDSGALYVHFDLDRTDLRRSFRQNAVTLDSIIYLVSELMADTLAEMSKIQIVGLASIEGRISHNEWLAGERGNALKLYIQQHLQVADSLFEVANGGEAWAELRYQAEQSNFIGKDELLEVIDTVADLDKREALIRQLKGGRTYEYLRDNMLKDQRNSGYIRVYYNVKKINNNKH